MRYSVVTSDKFERVLKKLRKKYSSLKQDYADFLDSLENDPTQGTPLGKDCYKIRLAISSKGKGKRGGGRVITCVKVVQKPFIYWLFMTRPNEILFRMTK